MAAFEVGHCESLDDARRTRVQTRDSTLQPFLISESQGGMDELQQRTSEICQCPQPFHETYLVAKYFLAVHFPDADLIFQSSDGVRFHIHSKYLENTSGGFAPSEFPTKDEVIMLPETAETLELMFQFVYPRRQPVLAFLSFGTLGALAEASEKYEIYPAMQICNIYMTHVDRFVPNRIPRF